MLLGIDLGTTNSVCAYLDEDGEPQVVENFSDGERIIPSVVMFDEEETLVGKQAKANSVLNPENVIKTVKLHMGEKVVLKKLGDTEYTPEMISACILRKLIQDALESLEPEGGISGVVITVPADFTDAQRTATEDAAFLSEIPLIDIINEPTAAATYYSLTHNLKGQNILVYDWGGGTFDVTILHADEEGAMTVLGTGGFREQAGVLFDQFIVDHVVEEIDSEFGIDLEDEEYAEILQDIYLKAESAKINLSSRQKADIAVRVGSIFKKITITREWFEEQIAYSYAMTEQQMADTLENDAKLKKEQIDTILLVGGTSRIPYVTESIKQFFGKEPSKMVNPDTAVALGAAVCAGLREKEGAKRMIRDVNSHSIGVAVTVDLQTEERENQIIVPRNSRLPAQGSYSFYPMCDGQRQIDLAITEGEAVDLGDVIIVGEQEILLPAGIKEESVVHLRIDVDRKQLIHVMIEIPDVGLKEEFMLKRASNLSDEEKENARGIMRAQQIY